MRWFQSASVEWDNSVYLSVFYDIMTTLPEEYHWSCFTLSFCPRRKTWCSPCFKDDGTNRDVDCEGKSSEHTHHFHCSGAVGEHLSCVPYSPWYAEYAVTMDRVSWRWQRRVTPTRRDCVSKGLISASLTVDAPDNNHPYLARVMAALKLVKRAHSVERML